jgi:hypothetical protein
MNKFTYVSIPLMKMIKYNMQIEEDAYENYGILSHCGILNFKNEDVDQFVECIQWIELCMHSNFDLYGRCKRIGKYENIKPVNKEVLFKQDSKNVQGRVFFDIEHLREDNWKDWFIEEKIGLLQGELGTIVPKEIE